MNNKYDKRAQKVVTEAVYTLQTWPCVKYKADWHPYYWQGRIDAAREIIGRDIQAFEKRKK